MGKAISGDIDYRESMEYYAGILDHDASICLVKQTRYNREHPIVVLGYHTNEGVAIRLQLTGQKAVNLLDSALPYMRVQRQIDRATAAIDCWGTRPAASGTRRSPGRKKPMPHFFLRPEATVQSPESRVLTAESGVQSPESVGSLDEAFTVLETAVRSPQSAVRCPIQQGGKSWFPESRVLTAEEKQAKAKAKGWVLNPSGSHNYEECPCVDCGAKRRTMARIKERSEAVQRGEDPGRF